MVLREGGLLLKRLLALLLEQSLNTVDVLCFASTEESTTLG